jgi:hypothetical protein
MHNRKFENLCTPSSNVLAPRAGAKKRKPTAEAALLLIRQRTRGSLDHPRKLVEV